LRERPLPRYAVGMPFADNDVPNLAGHSVIVTGGNGGLGFEAARVFARQHANVVLACRSLDRGRAARQTILTEYPSAHVEVMELDLASLASVRKFADAVWQAHPKLNLLINNAGVMAIPRQTTQEGFELQLGVNHLGHFALTGLLLPKLLATPGARVVNVSSSMSNAGFMRWNDLDGAQRYNKWLAYGQSKLANLLFTFELARRLERKHANVLSLACHPGYAATNLQLVGPQLEGSKLGELFMRIGNRFFAQSARGGAESTLYAATSPAAKSGDYIGPTGPMGMRGAPAPVKAKKAAYDTESQQKLWQISVERTGVDYVGLDA
jgi:NAD(P)-dependent dehydrogenase (short-subunit alcohol dehydrogenase family)